MQLKVGESANQKYLPFSKLYKGIAFRIILKSAKDLLQPRSTSSSRHHGFVQKLSSSIVFQFNAWISFNPSATRDSKPRRPRLFALVSCEPLARRVSWKTKSGECRLVLKTKWDRNDIGTSTNLGSVPTDTRISAGRRKSTLKQTWAA